MISIDMTWLFQLRAAGADRCLGWRLSTIRKAERVRQLMHMLIHLPAAAMLLRRSADPLLVDMHAALLTFTLPFVGPPA